MKVLLAPIGSAGDVHPFVALGVALRDRGHTVTLITNEHFEPLARREGFDFAALSTAEEYLAVLRDPRLWQPCRGALLFLQKLVLESMRPMYRLIAERAERDTTVVVAAGQAIGARLAQERLKIPLATAHICPVFFRSAYQSPRLPGLPLPAWTPPPLKRLAFRISDRMTDALMGREVNTFRAELGLPPAKRLLWDWWNSPQLVLGLFPDWYGAPQPDWPPQTHLIGFPLYDRGNGEPPAAELVEFLAAGEPPLAFTPGTAMAQGRHFFQAAIEACRLLGRRGILFTQFPEHLPAALPSGVQHFSYVPFSYALPRVAALVHHGGIGTTAQALAAGIPQLIMPMGFDQPDNTARLEQLGVARSLLPRAFRGPAVARELEQLLSSQEVRSQCRALAARFTAAVPADSVCESIEQLASESVTRAIAAKTNV